MLFYNMPSYYNVTKLAITFPINGLLDVLSMLPDINTLNQSQDFSVNQLGTPVIG